MHGYGRYTMGCRCDICREAKAAYMRLKRRTGSGKRRVAEADGWGRHFVPAISHGLSGYQDHQCRCDKCRAAKAAASTRESRNRTEPSEVR